MATGALNSMTPKQMGKGPSSPRPTIGVVAGWQFYWTATPLSYLNPLFEGICAAARELDSNLLLACGIGLTASPNDPFRPAWPEPASDADFVPVGPWNTDGLIVVNPLHSPARSRYVQDLIAAGHPVLFVGSGEGPPEIVADNAQGIRQAIEHLAEHGHQRLAFIAGSRDDLAGDSGDRLRAYQAAVNGDPRLIGDPALIAYGRHVFDGGYAAMQEILASGAPFTAVLASNDESAFGALRALKEAGRRIPEDVAVIGFDDRPEALIQTPPLASVRIPLYDLGYQALHTLVEMIAGQRERGSKIQARVPARLVPRRSCGCGQPLQPDMNARPAATPDAFDRAWAQRLAQAVQLESRRLPADVIGELCTRLGAAFGAADALVFRQIWDDVVLHCETAGEEVSIWQAALDLLRGEAASPAITLQLDRAYTHLAEASRRQARQAAVEQRAMLDRLGHLTAQLLLVTDEAQVFDVLARQLPEMGIPRAMIVSFEAEGDDPVAWSLPRWVPPWAGLPARFASRQYPPPGPAQAPFSQVLLPLVCQRGRPGYVVFDAVNLYMYGSIVQQIAAALDRAQLYRDAVEGRQLAEEAAGIKSRFLSTVSHELRMPLNLIVGLSEMALREGEEGGAPLPELLRQDLERIYAHAQHLGGLIGDVLDLAGSDAGQLRLRRDLVDLGQVLHMAAEVGRQLADDKGLTWRAVIPEVGPWVWGDPTRLRQIVLNLLNNAVKFTAHGEVGLHVTTTSQEVTVTVQDTGIGVAVAEQALIFDEFRRSERSQAGGYGGLGLGLAICKRLVELQGGALRLTSTGVDGEGSKFSFTLPTVQPPDPQTETAEAPRTILLLVGDADQGEAVRADLSRRGFEVRMVALAGWHAPVLPYLTPLPGLIMVEASLAAQHGWEVLRTLRDGPDSREVPLLFFSLSAGHGAVLELDYLTKPVGLGELTRALDQQGLITGRPEHKTILIVDDDANTVEMYARMVHTHSAHHRTLKAYDGRTALAILQHERVDLVLLDLMMPDMDGFEVLAAMRAAEPLRDTPVIVLTGQTLTEPDMRRLNRGVATVLSKGLFSADETLAHIQAALGRRRKLSGQAQQLVRQAMAYMHAHYAEPITRTNLARHLGMNEDYLTLCFRKELGMTPIAYLNRYRINQAKHLLIVSAMSITEIALAVGFSDSGYFSRVFRQRVGMAPEAFRRA